MTTSSSREQYEVYGKPRTTAIVENITQSKGILETVVENRSGKIASETSILYGSV